MTKSLSRLVAQMDNLYEYDREPVATHKLQSGWQFAGLFAGEHVAATEFVIGPFFVLHGVTARDLILGLLVGNILAVLSWTFICAPIAVRTRLTLYWYLRKIAGPGLTLIYNVAVALLYCILAGAMISVSATAVSSMIGVPTPELTDVLPSSATWALMTIVIGIVFTALAILGFEKLSKFAAVCSPWLFPIFIAGAVAMLPQLGVKQDFSNFWEIAETRIWTGVPTPGQEPFHIWHVVFFAWFANLAMHIGLSDMAVFRYAKDWRYGLYSACGMFPGHMLAWICSGVMVAGINRQMNPGLMAFEAAGVAGVMAVVIAGWTTANPTLYRAGLALQSVTPNWPRWKITLAAGAVTSVLSCFPIFFMKLLDYVAIYGLILMPMGAIVLVEHWLLARIGVEQYVTEKRSASFNWNALLVWVGTLALAAVLPMHLFFRWLPCFFVAIVAYTALQYMTARKSLAAEARA
jgi:purine-cytosine permease-like protein